MLRRSCPTQRTRHNILCLGRKDATRCCVRQQVAQYTCREPWAHFSSRTSVLSSYRSHIDAGFVYDKLSIDVSVAFRGVAANRRCSPSPAFHPHQPPRIGRKMVGGRAVSSIALSHQQPDMLAAAARVGPPVSRGALLGGRIKRFAPAGADPRSWPDGRVAGAPVPSYLGDWRAATRSSIARNRSASDTWYVGSLPASSHWRRRAASWASGCASNWVNSSGVILPP